MLLHHGMGFTFGTNLETCQLPIDCLFYLVFTHLPVIVQELRCELLSYLLRLDASDHLLAVAVLGRRRDTCIGELEVWRVVVRVWQVAVFIETLVLECYTLSSKSILLLLLLFLQDALRNAIANHATGHFSIFISALSLKCLLLCPHLYKALGLITLRIGRGSRRIIQMRGLLIKHVIFGCCFPTALIC